MEFSKKFDYHLKKKEQASVEKAVPMTQAKIHMALRANLEIDKHIYHEGAVVLSEHYLIFLKRRMIGKAFKHLLYVHMYEVLMASTRNDVTFELSTERHIVRVVTPVAIRLARNFMRNYLISGHNIPPPFRFSFKAHDMEQFPPFEPKMSPSQSFQFAYNSHCSLYDAPYIHEIVQYYHSLLINEVGVFDFNQLPLTAIEDSYKQAIDMRTVIGALEFDRFIFGLHCNNLHRPDIYSNLAPLLARNNNLRIFAVRKCGAENGLFQIADQMKRNKNININYWDISDNKFEDISYFIERFETYPNEVFYLNLNNTNMTATNVLNLMEYIKGNEKLWSIKYLYLRNSVFSMKSASVLGELLTNKKFKLKALAITGEGCNSFVEKLRATNYQLEFLSIRRSKLTAKTVTELVQYIKSSTALKALDISNTEIAPKQIISIISAFGENQNLRGVSLALNHLDLRGRNLIAVLDAFKKTDLSKWLSVTLAKNDMKADDLHEFIEVAKKMTNIISISLDGPLRDNDVPTIMKIKSLQKFRLRGCQNIFLLFDELAKNKTLKSLNVKHISFGSDGYNRLANILNMSKSLQEIRADFCKPRDIAPLLNYLDAVAISDHLIEAQFPIFDTSYLINSTEEKNDQKTFLHNLVEKQIKGQIKVTRNLLTVGMNSKLSLKRIPELDSLITTLGIEMISKLQKARPTIHSAVTSVLDLPLPYQNSDDKFEDAGEIKQGDSTLTTEVVENTDSMSQIQTLQFNSLIIKRPSTKPKGVDDLLEGRASTFDMTSHINDDDDDAPANGPAPSEMLDDDDMSPPDLSKIKIAGPDGKKKKSKDDKYKMQKLDSINLDDAPPPPTNPLSVPPPPSIPGM